MSMDRQNMFQDLPFICLAVPHYITCTICTQNVDLAIRHINSFMKYLHFITPFPEYGAATRGRAAEEGEPYPPREAVQVRGCLSGPQSHHPV